MTSKAFVIGHPIGHSRSPMLHGYWIARHGLDATYDRLDVTPEGLGDFFRRFREERIIGANVTMPHKLAVVPYMDRIDEAARVMGTVNCIWWEGETLVGGNTDALGYMANLDVSAPGWDRGTGRAVVIGAGGAARAVIHGLLGRGQSVAICNRTIERAQDLADHFGKGTRAHGIEDLPALLAEADLLVNTTSLGMIGQPPLLIDLGPLKPSAVVSDVIYVPLETRLLQAAAARGLRTVDGLGMLLYQGVEGFEHWFGIRPEVTAELRGLLEKDIREKTPGA